MKISVKSLTGEEIFVEVDQSDFVADLKIKIESQNAIPPDHQRLIFHGRELNDTDSLQRCSIENGSRVHLVPVVDVGTPITLSLFPFSLRVEVNTTDRILAIKRKICDKDGIPPEQQRLVYCGKQMEDDYVLDDFLTESDRRYSYVRMHLLLRLRGD
jgi:ubiquitin